MRPACCATSAFVAPACSGTKGAVCSPTAEQGQHHHSIARQHLSLPAHVAVPAKHLFWRFSQIIQDASTYVAGVFVLLMQVGDHRVLLTWRAHTVRGHGRQAVALACSRGSRQRTQISTRSPCIQSCCTTNCRTSPPSDPTAAFSCSSGPCWPGPQQQWQQQAPWKHDHRSCS